MSGGGGGRFGGGLSALKLTVVTAKQQHNAVVLKTPRNSGLLSVPSTVSFLGPSWNPIFDLIFS